MKLTGLLALLLLLMVSDGISSDPATHNNDYLNSFAVQVTGGLVEAEAVASDLGFLVDRELPNIGVFLLKHPEVNHRSKRSADHHVSRLQSHPKVRYVQQEVELKRVKRNMIYDKQLELPIREIKDNSVYHRIKMPTISVRDYEDEVTFNDPLFGDMWYLKNHGQSGGERYLDMNVQVAWANGFTGEGVVVCTLDDGVDHTHPDLAANYDPKASADLNDKSDRMQDPMPNMTNPNNSHGTRCAGEIAAAANNEVCGVGVAYNARIGGIRILDGTVTDSLEGEALKFNSNYVDIYSASWGPNDDGKTMEAPSYFASQALKDGVFNGRGGLGNIYVWATGNGGMHGDDCNADGYTSSVETLSVGSITDWGRQPFYMENCSSTLAVVPTGGEEYEGQEEDMGQIKLKVVTTDMGGGCIENFQGTSSAAPLAAGCLANVLQANPSLTWRDIQHVVVQGTRIPSADSSWTINGGGHHVSHKFGFGLMDCGKMVQVAQQWNNVPEQHVCQFDRNDPQKIGFGHDISDSVYSDGCKGDRSKWIQRLEHVQVRLKLSTRRRGDTYIFLTSPSGTRSELLSGRPNDDHQGNWEFTFMTVHSWDENPEGKWHLEIYDKPSAESSTTNDKMSRLGSSLDASSPDTKGYLEEWSLVLYGTTGERYGRGFQPRPATKRAYKASEEVAQRIKRDETKEARNLHVKRASVTKRQHGERTKTENQVSDEAVSRLAAQLSNLLVEEETREHVKRILTEKHPSVSKKPQGYQLTRQGGAGHQSSFLNKEDEHLLKEVVQGLKNLLSKSEKTEPASEPKDVKEDPPLVEQKQTRNINRNLKVTERALLNLLRYLRNP